MARFWSLADLTLIARLTSSAELYDPDTGTCAYQPYDAARSAFALSLLPNGQALASGGPYGEHTMQRKIFGI